MKRVFLLRHAKAEQANKDTPADSERPLTERGRKDAPLVGLAMREKGYSPDLILCSPSTRTRETLELAQGQFDGKAHVEFVEELYAASARKVAQIIRELPDKARKPLLVGHNPGFEECASLLAGKSDDPKAHARFNSLTEKFPTSALAVLDFDVAQWKDVESHSGALIDFIRPKDLKD